MISTVRTLAFFAGPIDGLKMCLSAEIPTDIIMIDGYEGHYQYAGDLTTTSHRFEWQSPPTQIVPPPPIQPV